MITVGVLFGGRAVDAQASLKSAMSFVEHLQASYVGDEQLKESDAQKDASEGQNSKSGIKVVPYFADEGKKWYRLSTAQLYSCTLQGLGVHGYQQGEQLQSWEVRAKMWHSTASTPDVNFASLQDKTLGIPQTPQTNC